MFEILVQQMRYSICFDDVVQVPHSFVLHSYTKPTMCHYCKKLLKGKQASFRPILYIFLFAQMLSSARGTTVLCPHYFVCYL